MKDEIPKVYAEDSFTFTFSASYLNVKKITK